MASIVPEAAPWLTWVGLGLILGDPALPAPLESSLPFTCLFWNSERKRVMRSDGMAKEMPAATLSVLMPMTSPSWAKRAECGVGGVQASHRLLLSQV